MLSIVPLELPMSGGVGGSIGFSLSLRSVVGYCNNRKVFVSMQPLDTDMEYVTNEPRPLSRGARLNVLFILPLIGLLLVLLFISAAIFQFDLSGTVDTLVGLMMLFFVLMIVLLFWALAPRANNP